MRDYCTEYVDGRRVMVADLPTQEIHEILRDGFVPLGNDTVAAITERLLLEIFIREKGLRDAP